MEAECGGWCGRNVQRWRTFISSAIQVRFPVPRLLGCGRVALWFGQGEGEWGCGGMGWPERKAVVRGA